MSRIILVGGGSSSGKSYVTQNVIKNIGEENVTRITLDDYYNDQKDMPFEERMKVNYDHPKAFDWHLLRDQVFALKNDQTIQKPVYDFVAHTRSDKIEVVTPKKLVIVEGIMALVDKKLRDIGDLRVFISASAERRFLRRMIRDKKERGRTFDNIVTQYFTTVQPMYDEIIKPSSIYADLIVNNDGVENLAIDVLTWVFKEELARAESGIKEDSKASDEFNEGVLENVFKD
ncbi:MAG: uridine kinase [Bacilli bacterium]|jgi:uridine kinase|nr:uridine kinase [Bacilli bacterium]